MWACILDMFLLPQIGSQGRSFCEVQMQAAVVYNEVCEQVNDCSEVLFIEEVIFEMEVKEKYECCTNVGRCKNDQIKMIRAPRNWLA